MKQGSPILPSPPFSGAGVLTPSREGEQLSPGSL